MARCVSRTHDPQLGHGCPLISVLMRSSGVPPSPCDTSETSMRSRAALFFPCVGQTTVFRHRSRLFQILGGMRLSTRLTSRGFVGCAEEASPSVVAACRASLACCRIWSHLSSECRAFSSSSGTRALMTAVLMSPGPYVSVLSPPVVTDDGYHTLMRVLLS